MTTALISHSDCLAHVNPPGHPERVDRLRAVNATLEAEGFAYLVRIDAPLADDALLLDLRCLEDEQGFIAQLERLPQSPS